MTCNHVLGLIDAGPFADYPRAHLEAAWQHARQCATCGPALEAATALTSGLAALPQVETPAELAKSVLARIAQVEQPAFVPADAPIREPRAGSITREWPAWATALGGLAATLAVVLSIPRDSAWLDFASPRVGVMTTAGIAVPDSTTWALVLGVGLVVYSVGLFAMLGSRSRW